MVSRDDCLHHPCEASTAALFSGVEEARLVREHDRLHAVTEVELQQDVRDVGLHSGVADVELPRNLRV